MNKKFGLSDIKYKYNTTDAKAIFEHLKLLDLKYYPTIKNLSDLKNYAQKLSEYASRFEFWENNKLIGIVAAYLNDDLTKVCYISNVSILESYRRRGLAVKLISKCIHNAISNNFITIQLNVNANNPATQLYESMNFITIRVEKDILIMSKKLNS